MPVDLDLWITRSPNRDWIAEISGFSQVPGRTLLVDMPWAHTPRGTLCARPLRRRGCCLPLVPRRRLPDRDLSRLDYHGLHTRCLRLAARVTPRLRKTCFRWVANPCRVGFGPTGSTTKSFRHLLHPSSLPRLGLARGTYRTSVPSCLVGRFKLAERPLLVAIKRTLWMCRAPRGP